MRDRAPASRCPALHFDALRLVALREGGRIEGTLATENERKAHAQQARAFWCRLVFRTTPSHIRSIYPLSQSIKTRQK